MSPIVRAVQQKFKKWADLNVIAVGALAYVSVELIEYVLEIMTL